MLNVVTSLNIANPGATVLTTKINREFLKVFEPNLLFWRFSEAPIDEKGYSSVTWRKPNRLVVTPADALMTPGVTPISTPITIDSITVSSKQYGIYSVLSDEVLLRLNADNLPGVASDLIAANMARIVDRVVQDAVLDNATNRFYAATTSGGTRAANRAALTANNKVFAYDYMEAHRRLQANYAPYIDGSYFSFIHTNVYIYLQSETGTGGFLDINKYKRPEMIDRAEVGMLSNIRILVSPYIKTYQSNIKVYPTLFIGQQAYGASQLSAMETIVKALGSGGTTDPLNQRMTVGVKTFFASTILQQESVLVLESAGIDS